MLRTDAGSCPAAASAGVSARAVAGESSETALGGAGHAGRTADGEHRVETESNTGARPAGGAFYAGRGASVISDASGRQAKRTGA